MERAAARRKRSATADRPVGVRISLGTQRTTSSWWTSRSQSSRCFSANNAPGASYFPAPSASPTTRPSSMSTRARTTPRSSWKGTCSNGLPMPASSSHHRDIDSSQLSAKGSARPITVLASRAPGRPFRRASAVHSSDQVTRPRRRAASATASAESGAIVAQQSSTSRGPPSTGTPHTSSTSAGSNRATCTSVPGPRRFAGAGGILVISTCSAACGGRGSSNRRAALKCDTAAPTRPRPVSTAAHRVWWAAAPSPMRRGTKSGSR